MFRSHITPVLVLSLMAVAALSGCVGEDEGRVVVYVKDAPTDEFSSIFITFTEVAIHRGGEDEDDGEDPDTSGSGWETVFEGEREIDLLQYSDEGARALLGDANLSAGVYNQIVVTISDAHGISAEDGSEVDITVTTGWVRVVRAVNITGDETTRIVIDLDLDRSLVQAGPTGWRLNPVVGQMLVEESAGGDEGDRSDEA